MSASGCVACRNAKAPIRCGIFEGAVCKQCVQRLDKDTFHYLVEVPKDLTHKSYCNPCFSEKVATPLAHYQYTLGRARKVWVFIKSKSEETRLMSRSEKPLKVVDCVDEETALLRLAYLAAEKKVNALIDVDIVGKKVRNHGYQTSTWQGTGVPTQVDGERLERENKSGR